MIVSLQVINNSHKLTGEMLLVGTRMELATIRILTLLRWVLFVVALRNCGDKQFSVKTESGTTKCRDCPLCPEGYEVTPTCGKEISHNASIGCVSCVEGKTFSDTRDVGACQICGICSEGQVIKHNCTQQSQIVCDNRCYGKAIYFNEPTKDCQPCSQCCKDGHDTVIEECSEKGMVLEMQCSVYDKLRCQKSTAMTPETRDLKTQMVKTQDDIDNLSTMAPGQVRQSEFDISSRMAPTQVTVTTKQQTATGSTGKMDEPFPYYLEIILVVVATCVCSSVFFILIKRQRSRLSSRPEHTQLSRNCHQRCNNRNCVSCAEEGHYTEDHQMTEREVTRENNSGNSTGSTSNQENESNEDVENEISEDKDESENDPLIVSLPEEIEHASNTSSNQSSGNSSGREEANQITNGSISHQENDSSSEDVDKESENNPLVASLLDVKVIKHTFLYSFFFFLPSFL